MSKADMNDILAYTEEHYFNKPSYIESSPLTQDEKLRLSTTEIGKADFDNLGFFDFIKD